VNLQLAEADTHRHVPTVDEAIEFIIKCAREIAPQLDERGAIETPPSLGDAHHHLTIEQLLRSYFDWRTDPATAEPAAIIAEPVFIEAAWELSLRGMLRPGPWHGVGANSQQGGYCITRHGQKWLTTPANRQTAF